MSVLSAATQRQVEDELVEQKLISQDRLDDLRKKSISTSTPIFSLLISEGGIDSEDLTKVTAQITKVPYVNLTSAPIYQANE